MVPRRAAATGSRGRPPRPQSVPALRVRPGPWQPAARSGPGGGRMQRRPGGVTFAGWLMGIHGALSAVGGLIVLLVASNTRVMTHHGPSQRGFLLTGAVLLFGAIVATLFRRPDPFGDLGDTILRWFADHDGPTTVDLAKGLNALTSVAAVMSARVAIVGILALSKRWRHLVVALGTFV